MFIKYLSFCCSKHTSSSQRQYPTVIEELCHQFLLADLRKSTNNFDENQIVGSGVLSIVYKGSLQLNGVTECTVAMKRICGNTEETLKQFKNEIELLCQLRHPNLMTLLGFCDHKDEKIVVYEYMPNGSLHDRLYCSDVKKEPLTWKHRLKICIGAAHGLHYIHTGAIQLFFFSIFWRIYIATSTIHIFAWLQLNTRTYEIFFLFFFSLNGWMAYWHTTFTDIRDMKLYLWNYHRFWHNKWFWL